jgi:hypothetical protein
MESIGPLCCSEEKQETSFHLGDAEDDFVAAEELAEEAVREVESVDLKELTRQCTPNVRQRVWCQRCLDWFPRQHRRSRSRYLDISGDDISGEAAAAQLFLPGRGVLETWRRGLA